MMIQYAKGANANVPCVGEIILLTKLYLQTLHMMLRPKQPHKDEDYRWSKMLLDEFWLIIKDFTGDMEIVIYSCNQDKI